MTDTNTNECVNCEDVGPTSSAFTRRGYAIRLCTRCLGRALENGTASIEKPKPFDRAAIWSRPIGTEITLADDGVVLDRAYRPAPEPVAYERKR